MSAPRTVSSAMPSLAGRASAATLLVLLLPLGAISAQVRFERTGYRLTSIGERIAVSARIAGSGRATPNIQWRVADPSIATVDRKGVVVSRKVGFTRLWAVAGSDSASAIILVDQWAATFDFFPAIVRLDAVGAKAALRIQVRDAAGYPITDPERRITACRSLNERIAILDANGEVTARENGVTYVRCTDRGVADSVRIEVRQRAARAMIADKLGFGNKVVGDTFRIRLSAVDPSGDEIRDPGATWASLNPTVVSIDPLSGMARSASPGTVKIVAQVGDATDTVSVQVLPGMGMAPLATGDATDAFAPLTEIRAPSLHLQPLFVSVGDTARLTPRDATGAPIANAAFRITSQDSNLVRPISGQRIVARRPGNTYVVAEFGGIRDSALVSVREKADFQTMAFSVAANTAVFVRPTFNLDSAARRNRAQLDSASRAIQRQSVVAIYTGRMVSISALAMHAAHATRDTNFLEKRTGLLYGATAELAPHRRVKLSGSFRTGQLSPAGIGEDLAVTEVEGDLTLQPAPWFGLRGGYVVRTTTTEIATQRWAFPKASAVTRFSFVGGAINTITAISLLPGATYTGYLDASGATINPNPYSLAGEAGLEMHSGAFSAGLSYYAERFSFPKVNNNADGRTDQFSALRLRLGFQLGR